MNRLLASLALSVALCATTLVPASAAPINLRNGLIIVYNASGVPLTVRMLTLSGAVWESETVAPGTRYNTFKCCYAAGTQYRIYFSSRVIPGRNMSFTPILCNRDGIPYGYAAFNADPKSIEELAHGCYNGPL